MKVISMYLSDIRFEFNSSDIDNIDVLFLSTLQYGDYLLMNPKDFECLQLLDISKVVLVINSSYEGPMDCEYRDAHYAAIDNLSEFDILYRDQTWEHNNYNFINYAYPDQLYYLLKDNYCNILLGSRLHEFQTNTQLAEIGDKFINLVLSAGARHPTIQTLDETPLTVSTISLEALRVI